jgi:hypothetical protein
MRSVLRQAVCLTLLGLFNMQQRSLCLIRRSAMETHSYSEHWIELTDHPLPLTQVYHWIGGWLGPRTVPEAVG